MIGNLKNDLNTKRESNKIGLETFALNRKNILDRPIDILIKDLKKQIDDEFKEHQKWIDMQENNPEKFNEIEEKAQQSGYSLFSRMQNYIMTAMYMEEELTTLYEMKIIYAFKQLEIEIKNLISASYTNSTFSKSSKWENLIQFLKAKNIDLTGIKAYQEVNQLRIVNNSLKHSNEQIDNSLNEIEEFKEVDNISYYVLEKFYSRIKFSPSSFLTDLSRAIYDNLYEFDDNKLDEISNSIVLRMDIENAEKLIERIKKHYE